MDMVERLVVQKVEYLLQQQLREVQALLRKDDPGREWRAVLDQQLPEFGPVIPARRLYTQVQEMFPAVLRSEIMAAMQELGWVKVRRASGMVWVLRNNRKL